MNQLIKNINIKTLNKVGTFQSKKDDAYVITMYALKLGYRHIGMR